MRFKIISGGQTGVDRAALDAALDLGIEIGGFLPKGRKALDGVVPGKYINMIELESDDYIERTKANVMAADATIIFLPRRNHSSPGTNRTRGFCQEEDKPMFIGTRGDVVDCHTWMDSKIVTLGVSLFSNRPISFNCAGPRDNPRGGNEIGSVYEDAYRFFLNVFEMSK